MKYAFVYCLKDSPVALSMDMEQVILSQIRTRMARAQLLVHPSLPNTIKNNFHFTNWQNFDDMKSFHRSQFLAKNLHKFPTVVYYLP